MKKILAGMFYRLIKGYEFWALIALVLISSFFLTYTQLSSDALIGFSRGGPDINTQYQLEDNNLTADNIDDYRFAGLGISAHDLYRADSEVLPDDVFEKLYNTGNIASYETRILFSILCGMHSFPVILIIIFIPLFFGRLFSDGTIKNLISSGHSKGKIYLSSLFFMSVIDLLIILINIMALAVLCLYFKWSPPVYLPVVLMLLLIELLSVVTVSALCMAVLFISMKKMATFIVGFVIGVISFLPVSGMTAQEIYYYEWRFDQQSEDYDTYINSFRPENMNRLEFRINVREFREEFYLDGRKLELFEDSKMTRASKVIALSAIYLDPFMISDFRDSAVFDQYSMYRDGLMAVNVGSNVLWTALATACGIVIFKKREIR